MPLRYAIVMIILAFAAGVAAVPYPVDPVQVAPHIYEIAYENDRVRVLRRTIRKGEISPLVAQPDRVVIYLNPCGWLESDGEGGERMQSFKWGEPTWAPADSHGGTALDVIQECKVLEIELLE